MTHFPMFDLGRFEAADSQARAAMGEDVDTICRSTGFLAIANHGVPAEVIDDGNRHEVLN